MIHLLDGKQSDTTIHDRSTVQLVNITKRAMAASREWGVGWWGVNSWKWLRHGDSHITQDLEISGSPIHIRNAKMRRVWPLLYFGCLLKWSVAVSRNRLYWDGIVRYLVVGNIRPIGPECHPLDSMAQRCAGSQDEVLETVHCPVCLTCTTISYRWCASEVQPALGACVTNGSTADWGEWSYSTVR